MTRSKKPQSKKSVVGDPNWAQGTNPMLVDFVRGEHVHYSQIEKLGPNSIIIHNVSRKK